MKTIDEISEELAEKLYPREYFDNDKEKRQKTYETIREYLIIEASKEVKMSFTPANIELSN